MAIPTVVCSADIILDYGISPRTIQLEATATNGPIILWRWNIKSVPTGSTANIGIKGDFTDGVATIQSPQIVIDGDIDGGYCFECIAKNIEGASNPKIDAESGQQLIIVRTSKFQLYLPSANSYNWGQTYLDPTLRSLEQMTVVTTEGHGVPKGKWGYAGIPQFTRLQDKLQVKFGWDSGYWTSTRKVHKDAHVCWYSDRYNTPFRITMKLSFIPNYTAFYQPMVGIILGEGHIRFLESFRGIVDMDWQNWLYCPDTDFRPYPLGGWNYKYLIVRDNYAPNNYYGGVRPATSKPYPLAPGESYNYVTLDWPGFSVEGPLLASIYDWINGPFIYGVSSYPTSPRVAAWWNAGSAEGNAASRLVSGIDVFLKVECYPGLANLVGSYSMDGKNWCKSYDGVYYDVRIDNYLIGHPYGIGVGYVFWANYMGDPNEEYNIAEVTQWLIEDL